MKYAKQVSEIMNAFSPAPLAASQMKEFYCEDTMEYRMSDKYVSPMEDISDLCQEQEDSPAVLSGMSFPVIYTFPIALSYETKFPALEGYFVKKTLPMIRIETIEGEKYSKGIAVIREIVEKRARLQLFEPEALERLIVYTGGSLRDLFFAINTSAKRAVRRKSDRVSMEDAGRALEERKTSLTRRIEQSDYEFLVHIYQGNKELIEDKETLLRMLQASVVLEYNGKRWHNVHPLVAQFLKEQGLMENERE